LIKNAKTVSSEEKIKKVTSCKFRVASEEKINSRYKMQNTKKDAF